MNLFLISFITLVVTFFLGKIVYDPSVAVLSNLVILLHCVSAVFFFYLNLKFWYRKTVSQRGLFLRSLYFVFTVPPTIFALILVVAISVMTQKPRIVTKGQPQTDDVIIGEEKYVRGTRIYKVEESFFRENNAFIVQEKPILNSKYFFLRENVCFVKYAPDGIEFEIVDDYQINCITDKGTEKIKLPY